MQAKKNRAVIMAAAEITEYSFYTPEPGDFAICADRGYVHALKLGITPDILLGDFDSLEMPLPPKVEIRTYPAEKDETDLQIAISCALEKGFENILVIGATGGRTDHFLANVFLLHWAKERGAAVVLEDETTRIRLLEGCMTLENRKNTYLSLLALCGDAQVSVSGVKYPLERAILPFGSTLGVSNEFAEEHACIEVHRGSVLVLECAADRCL